MLQVYINSIEDQLANTSNAGAVVHSLGTKPQADSYGLETVNRSSLAPVCKA